MTHLISTCVMLLFAVMSFGQTLTQKVSEADLSIGKTITIQSNFLKEKRTVNIYLPLSYSKDSLKNYPVIYLLDGAMDEDFLHIAGIVQFGSFSWINMVPEAIVVGIENVDRKRDFTSPTQNIADQKSFPTSGGSEKFISFLQHELQPFIQASFRTTPQKTIIGQSLGGLLASEILIKKPTLFDSYIIVSPSLWWNDEKLLSEPLPSFASAKAVYIAGGKEGEVMERTAKELYQKLKKQQNPDNVLYYEFLKDKTHGDALHIAVYHAFEKLFAPETTND